MTSSHRSLAGDQQGTTRARTTHHRPSPRRLPVMTTARARRLRTSHGTRPSSMPAIDERLRLRLETEFIRHADAIWPEGCEAATPEWIRANTEEILALLKWMYAIGDDGKPADLKRVPH